MFIQMRKNDDIKTFQLDGKQTPKILLSPKQYKQYKHFMRNGSQKIYGIHCYIDPLGIPNSVYYKIE
jgi:hypothetical protein